MNNNRQFIGKRIAATIIDYAVVGGLSFAYLMTFGTPNDEGGKSMSGLPALLPVALWFFYIVITENMMDGTMGHQLMKLKVVTLDYKHPRFSQTLIRRLADLIEISCSTGLLALIPVYRTEYCQRLGDILAKTMVIGRDSYVPDFDFDQRKQENT